MTRLLIFAAGIILGVLAAMKLTWSREPIEPAWREDVPVEWQW